MPKRKLSLVRGEEKRLEVSWNFGWKQVVVTLDGNEVGRIPDQAALEAGKTFTLDDNTALKVQLRKNVLMPELHVWRDDQPVPGSDGDPIKRLNLASGILFFVAGFNILVGLVVVSLQIDGASGLGLGIGSVIGGLIYLGLGFLVRLRSQPQLSMIALILGTALLILDGIAILVTSAGTGRSPISGLGLRVVLIMFLLRSFQAYGALKSPQADNDQKRGDF